MLHPVTDEPSTTLAQSEPVPTFLTGPAEVGLRRCDSIRRLPAARFALSVWAGFHSPKSWVTLEMERRDAKAEKNNGPSRISSVWASCFPPLMSFGFPRTLPPCSSRWLHADPDGTRGCLDRRKGVPIDSPAVREGIEMGSMRKIFTTLVVLGIFAMIAIPVANSQPHGDPVLSGRTERFASTTTTVRSSSGYALEGGTSVGIAGVFGNHGGNGPGAKGGIQ